MLSLKPAKSLIEPSIKWECFADPYVGRAVYKQRELSGSTLIYRYLRPEHLYEMLELKQFRMNSVRRWDDPYEKWLCQQAFRSGSKLKGAHAFGTCWTTRYLDEPFWRLHTPTCSHFVPGTTKHYPPSLPAVRIQTTVQKLASMFESVLDDHHGKAFLGRVRYTNLSAIRKKAADARSGTAKQVSGVAARLLMWKRTPYRFEKEIRALWIERRSARFRSFDFEPTELISRIMIGPSKDEVVRTRIKRDLISLGFEPHQIVKSMTYTLKP